MQLNNQPREKRQIDPRGLLEVVKVYPTIQGEGPFFGARSIFIRLAGCNLDCPGCDTDYTTGRSLENPGRIVQACQRIGKKWLVVITGGEPFRQNITPLVKQLLLAEYTVQIETNGVYDYPPGFPISKVHTVCSPKTIAIHPALHPDYYKYVLDAENVDKEDGLPSDVLGRRIRPARPGTKTDVVYIQPMDEKNEEKNTKNLEAVVKSCMTYGYLATIQSHKLFGLE